MVTEDHGLNIVIPTYKRAHHLPGRDYFTTAKYILPESQADDYAKVLPPERMIVIPDAADGNIARKRNWILKNISRPLLMIDDDVSCLIHSEKGAHEKLRQHIKLAPHEAHDVIINGFNLAHQWGCVLWGINVNTDGRNYQQYKPFSLTQVVLGPFQGHLDHDLLCDERMGTKDDYDFSLQVLNKYRKILRLNKFAYDCDHGNNKGGIVSMRTMEIEREYNRRIMNKWGSYIIKYLENPKKMKDLLNGMVSVPIKGV
jgi:hypothetical protein